MKKLCYLLMLATIAHVAQAQESFLIYTLQGNVTILENKSESKAKIGRLLSDKAEIIVAGGGAVSLICNENNLITLNKSGRFSLSDYKAQCKPDKSSVTSNYFKYIWSQLTSKPGTPEKNRKQYMSNVGAVSRSINSIWIDPRLDTLNYVAGDFPLSWKSYAEEEDFEFLLYSQKDIQVPIHVIGTKKKFVPIKELDKKTKEGEQYYWTAIVKGSANDERKILNYVTKEQYKKFLKEIEHNDGIMEDEAAKAFRMAFLLEQAHYLAQAYEHYKKAATLDPGLSLYAATLDSFKKDYGID